MLYITPYRAPIIRKPDFYLYTLSLAPQTKSLRISVRESGCRACGLEDANERLVIAEFLAKYTTEGPVELWSENADLQSAESLVVKISAALIATPEFQFVDGETLLVES